MKQKGFSLIELLVVISIIGLLTSIMLVAITHARSQARDARRIADLNHLAVILELYQEKVGQYPGDHSGDALTNYPFLIMELNSVLNLHLSINLPEQSSPSEKIETFLVPKALAGGVVTPPVATALQYGYVASADNQHYRLRAWLENPLPTGKNNGLTGPFTDPAQSTGNTACDLSLNYYCVGDPGTFVPSP